MTTAQAHRHHLMKMDLSNDLCRQANRAVNPSPRAIEYMRSSWLKERSGRNTPSMFELITKYGTDNPEITLTVSNHNDCFCVVVITPFMKRAHKELREAGEEVFVDATSCANQLNTSVIPFICAGPAGAVPLAMLFTSSQDEATLTKGFGMVKEALGGCAFFGRGEPQTFLTDNCNAERKALAATWPTSQCFLSIFHILQQVWRWLLKSKHAIQKHHRQELMASMKTLVYAKSIEDFNEVWDNIQGNYLINIYPIFKSYLSGLVQRKEEWAVAFRTGALLGGHHTNNFCEATMFVIKDIVLNRCRAFNTSQLIVFMVEIFDSYMKQRLIDVALRRRRVKPVSVGTVPVDAITDLGGGKYLVQSHFEATVYEVDITIDTCSCTKENGAICKHKAACADYGMTVVPQLFELNSQSQHWLPILGLGQDKAPDERFFQDLNSAKTEQNQRSEGASLNLPADTEVNCDIACAVNSENYSTTEDLFDEQHTEDDGEVDGACIVNSEAVAQTFVKTATQYGDANTQAAMAKFLQRLNSIKSTDQLNSFLSCTGLAVKSGGDGHGKIPCQPTSTAERSSDKPRGAAPLIKGHQPRAALASQSKRHCNLARNIQCNLADAESHESNQ